jgi:hypothetical protein
MSKQEFLEQALKSNMAPVLTGLIEIGLLCLTAIVIGGLMCALGEDDSRPMLHELLFTVGMVIGAINVIVWFFC